MYAGGTIGHKTKYQETMAHSTTEGEFMTAYDARKMLLYFRSLLQELEIDQSQATAMYKDNNDALMMANA